MQKAIIAPPRPPRNKPVKLPPEGPVGRAAEKCRYHPPHPASSATQTATHGIAFRSTSTIHHPSTVSGFSVISTNAARYRKWSRTRCGLCGVKSDAMRLDWHLSSVPKSSVFASGIPRCFARNEDRTKRLQEQGELDILLENEVFLTILDEWKKRITHRRQMIQDQHGHSLPPATDHPQ